MVERLRLKGMYQVSFESLLVKNCSPWSTNSFHGLLFSR